MFSDSEVSLLFALRSKCVKVCKANFRTHFKSTQDVFCKFCNESKFDDQPHMLECKELNKHVLSNELAKQQVKYSDIFENTEKQKEITCLFSKLLQIRSDKTINNYPSTPQYGVGSAEDLQDLHECIDSMSFGK